jgi:hypothetical protein
MPISEYLFLDATSAIPASPVIASFTLLIELTYRPDTLALPKAAFGTSERNDFSFKI